jgi:hypothetical protein
VVLNRVGKLESDVYLCITEQHLWRNIRTILSGPFGLPEDGASAAPKHVGARLIF